MVQLLPAKDKKRYLSMKSVPAPSEIAKAEQEIQQWGASMKTTDRDILSKTSSLSSAASMMSVRPTMKPVRGAVSSAAATPDSERKDNNHEEDDDSDQQQLQHLQFLSKVQRMKIQDQRTKLQVRLLTDMQRKHRASKSQTAMSIINCSAEVHTTVNNCIFFLIYLFISATCFKRNYFIFVDQQIYLQTLKKSRATKALKY